MRHVLNLAVAFAIISVPAAITSGAFNTADAQAREIKTDNRPFSLVCPNGLRKKCHFVRV